MESPVDKYFGKPYADGALGTLVRKLCEELEKYQSKTDYGEGFVDGLYISLALAREVEKSVRQ